MATNTHDAVAPIDTTASIAGSVPLAPLPGEGRLLRLRRLTVQTWYCLRQFALVLWIVRVPLATTALGLLILIFAPQAQDLFVEFAVTSHWWMVYFLFVLVAVWAMPTHYTARMLLDTDVRLGFRLINERTIKQKKQERTPLEDWEVGFATCLETSCTFIPRFLGFLTFVAVLSAIWRSHLNLPNLDEKEVIAAVNLALAEVAGLVLLGLIGFLLYVFYRPKDADLPLLRRVKHWNGLLVPAWRFISPGLEDMSEDDEESRDLGRLILFGIFVIFGVIFACGADFAASLFPRALAVPFILGGWLPILSYLSGLGRQWRAPLIAGLFGLVSVLAVVLGDDHSVRRIAAAAATDPLAFDTAVTMWMHENGCDGSASTCPRPVIIAAEGGASRAGFFLATIVGHLMQKDEAAKHGLDPNQVRDRLFAISSVSGGSMGAVMVTAALDAKNDSNDYPCMQKPVELWWGRTIGNWRDCFEALTSGDFLTADFFGFAFNDMWPFAFRDRAAVLEDTWTLRYETVVTRADATPATCNGLDCPFLALRPRPGHWIPLLVLNGTSEATGGRIVTTPLAKTYSPDKQVPCPSADVDANCPLFVQADRFHDLLNDKVGSNAWFSWVGWYERFLLRHAGGNDVRISTAAHNSARFPLISPPGTVRNNQDEAIVDRIVDGGYFENYGALSAKELALAVHAVQPQLAPLVIVISNDPDDPVDPNDDSSSAVFKGQLQATRQQQVDRARAQVNTTEWVTDITVPVKTIANSRTAHGTLGVDELHNALHQAVAWCDALLMQIRVWPQYDNSTNQSKAVSMSWWLSTPIQRHLHQQTEDDKDGNKNAVHLEAIWNELKNPSCVPPNKGS